MQGQAISVTQIGVTLVIAATVLMVGILVYSEIADSIDNSDFTTAENTTLANIKSTTLDAYDLAVVGLIVLAAVAVLGYIFLFRTGGA